jgi:hypothetical protein
MNASHFSEHGSDPSEKLTKGTLACVYASESCGLRSRNTFFLRTSLHYVVVKTLEDKTLETLDRIYATLVTLSNNISVK